MTIVTLLLLGGMDIDVADKYGITGLHIRYSLTRIYIFNHCYSFLRFISCGSNNTKLLEALLYEKCNVHAVTSDGCTGLHIACAAANLEIIEILLSRTQLDINDGDVEKWTPLMYAGTAHLLTHSLSHSLTHSLTHSFSLAYSEQQSSECC